MISGSYFSYAVRFQPQLSGLLGDRSGAWSRKVNGINSLLRKPEMLRRPDSFNKACSAFSSAFGLASHLRRPRLHRACPSKDAAPGLRRSLGQLGIAKCLDSYCRLAWCSYVDCSSRLVRRPSMQGCSSRLVRCPSMQGLQLQVSQTYLYVGSAALGQLGIANVGTVDLGQLRLGLSWHCTSVSLRSLQGCWLEGQLSWLEGQLSWLEGQLYSWPMEMSSLIGCRITVTVLQFSCLGRKPHTV